MTLVAFYYKTVILKTDILFVFIRSFLFLIFYLSYTLLFGPFCLLVCILTWPFMSFNTRFNLITSWVDVVMKGLSFICGIHYEIKGLENIPDTPCVIMSNHQSTWETLYSYKIFTPQATVLKRELLWIPIFGWALLLLRPIAINRGKKQQALKQLLLKAPGAIHDGFWYMAYPEGTRVSPEKDLPFASSSSLIACKNGFPVLPIAHNAGYCWPARRFLKYPGTITLSIGPIIQSEGKKAKDLTKEVETWVKNEQANLGSGLKS
jgi:1-acyl-sn-glycerol-3-phosphate acyltransferase